MMGPSEKKVGKATNTVPKSQMEKRNNSKMREVILNTARKGKKISFSNDRNNFRISTKVILGRRIGSGGGNAMPKKKRDRNIKTKGKKKRKVVFFVEG